MWQVEVRGQKSVSYPGIYRYMIIIVQVYRYVRDMVYENENKIVK